MYISPIDETFRAHVGIDTSTLQHPNICLQMQRQNGESSAATVRACGKALVVQVVSPCATWCASDYQKKKKTQTSSGKELLFCSRESTARFCCVQQKRCGSRKALLKVILRAISTANRERRFMWEKLLALHMHFAIRKWSVREVGPSCWDRLERGGGQPKSEA